MQNLIHRLRNQVQTITRFFVYRAYTQNIKRFECDDIESAKDLGKNCTASKDVMLRNGFILAARVAGFTDREAESILEAMTSRSLKEDDAIKSSGATLDASKVRKLLRSVFSGLAGNDSVGPSTARIELPNYSKKNNDINRDLVLSAMGAVRKHYYYTGEAIQKVSIPLYSI